MLDIYDYMTKRNKGVRIATGFRRLSIHSSGNRAFPKHIKITRPNTKSREQNYK